MLKSTVSNAFFRSKNIARVYSVSFLFNLDRQIDRQIDGQKCRITKLIEKTDLSTEDTAEEIETDKQNDIKIDIQNDKQIDRETDRQIDIHFFRDKQINRWIDRISEKRQIDYQLD